MLKWRKLAVLLIGVSIANIIIFSPGLIGLSITGGDALFAALGITIVVASLAILIYGMYACLYEKPPVIAIKNLQNGHDLEEALESLMQFRPLRDDAQTAIHQLRNMKRKKEHLASVLASRFSPTELSGQKFSGVIADVESLFYTNVRNIINKMSIFDDVEYRACQNRNDRVAIERKELYAQFFSYIGESLSINDEILLDMDKLLIELTRLDNVEIGDVDDMAAMKELDTLIKQTKLYKS